MLQDLKHAIHELRRSPAFTAVAVLTLALGIGANTAIFGVVNRVMLSPLPYPQAERFVYLSLSYQQGPFGMFVTIAPDVARDWLGAPSLEAAAAFSTHDFLAYDDRGARIVHGLAVTDGLPAFLGVQPVLGRAFSADDARPGAPPTVLLSYAMWQRDYGGAPDVLGRAITLDDVSRTVIGVMPARADAFAPAQASADVWLPLSLDTGPGAARGSDAIQVIARLRAGVSADTAARELNDLAERVWENRPAPRPDLKLVTRVRSSSDVFVQAGTRDGLVVLLGAVGAVLLVACANVANLLLARGAARSRDIALRAALGASGWRLVRQLLTECFVLALAAGVVGVALGWLMLRVIVPLRPRGLLDLSDIHLDPTVLAFTFGLSLVTAVVFGLVPALHVIPSTLGRALRHGGGGSGVVRGGGLRLRRLLVAGEMALCVILLVSAALLVRSIV
ncbi:MAG TPA: ABC transporter permease, partial [Gammaproteobacteria bacterium]|nr:ABC transporter permease [Gammaproteobacteria bacterium]